MGTNLIVPAKYRSDSGTGQVSWGPISLCLQSTGQVQVRDRSAGDQSHSACTWQLRLRYGTDQLRANLTEPACTGQFRLRYGTDQLRANLTEPACTGQFRLRYGTDQLRANLTEPSCTGQFRLRYGTDQLRANLTEPASTWQLRLRYGTDQLRPISQSNLNRTVQAQVGNRSAEGQSHRACLHSAADNSYAKRFTVHVYCPCKYNLSSFILPTVATCIVCLPLCAQRDVLVGKYTPTYWAIGLFSTSREPPFCLVNILRDLLYLTTQHKLLKYRKQYKKSTHFFLAQGVVRVITLWID